MTEDLAGWLELGHNQKTNKKGHTDYKNLDELLNPAATLSVGVEAVRVGAAERSCGEDVGATRTTFPHKKSVFENVLISVMIQPFASCSSFKVKRFQNIL